ncbi:MAG: hypothetical protein R6T89_05295 [Candidatus Syntrophosphaera sp.]
MEQPVVSGSSGDQIKYPVFEFGDPHQVLYKPLRRIDLFQGSAKRKAVSPGAY